MKKLLIAILFASVAFGSICRPVLAADGAMSKAEQRRLFMKGAKLWPLYCNTCHNARPGGEEAPYQWDQIIMHMRTLGNLPADDTQALLQYLKAK